MDDNSIKHWGKPAWILAFLLCSLASKAGDLDESLSSTRFFQHGNYEAALNSGVMFSPFVADKNRPVINYTLSEIQVGYMLTDVHSAGLLRGNFEVVGAGFGSAVFDGPGNYVAGCTLWGRFNFVPRASRFVPFLQAGAGLSLTDIDRSLVGQPFNFNLDLGAGLRCFVAEQWALNLEYRYQHLSNANTGRRNVGINSHGPMLGVSYLF